ncbi:MAG: hypothetical protein VKP62_10895 [Candidatus Sericytochromatia bacterium]|nr:hypothetical protein [Candidatus Sericytochromatia bacterium]
MSLETLTLSSVQSKPAVRAANLSSDQGMAPETTPFSADELILNLPKPAAESPAMQLEEDGRGRRVGFLMKFLSF